MKLLYVEDEDITRMLLKKMLKRDNIDVYDAANGVLGLKLYHAVEPDIIVTNLVMPVMDGFEMIDKIRVTDADIPIIVVTGCREEVIKISSMVNGYVFKPVLVNDLTFAINRFVTC